MRLLFVFVFVVVLCHSHTHTHIRTHAHTKRDMEHNRDDYLLSIKFSSYNECANQLGKKQVDAWQIPFNMLQFEIVENYFFQLLSIFVLQNTHKPIRVHICTHTHSPTTRKPNIFGICTLLSRQLRLSAKSTDRYNNNSNKIAKTMIRQSSEKSAESGTQLFYLKCNKHDNCNY